MCVATRADIRVGISTCWRNLGSDVSLILETSKGTSFESGGASSATGVEMVCEREQNVRNKALTVIVWRVCI